MPVSEKERLAAEVAKRYSAFEEALFGDKRRYPLQEFKEFWEAGRRYAELTRSDPLIHRKVVPKLCTAKIRRVPRVTRWN